jgi:membrane-bound lytic murein transglycosylase B
MTRPGGAGAVAGLLVLAALAGGCTEPDGPGPASPGTPATSREPTASSSPDEATEPRPTEPKSAAEAAEQVVAAELAIADPGTSAEALAEAGQLQQLAYRALATHSGWDDEVAALVPDHLRDVVADNVAVRRAFRSMHPARPGDLADELPAWRIVRPRPAAELRGYYREAERRFGVDWEYLAAINFVETAFGRIAGTSTAGAQGPMQFIPSTWAAYGRGDIRDPHDSILAAGRYLAANGFTRPGGRTPALLRYNNSTAYARGVTLLAELMARRPSAFRGYYHWQVYYLTSAGSILLPEGYRAERPIPVERWLADHPQ